MANGFIVLENGKDFYTRWTGYDMIIQVAIKELKNIREGEDLTDWLQTRIPNENEEKGDAIFFNSANKMIVRTIDLRGLTEKSRSLFWKAITIGAKCLNKDGLKYSNLNPDRLNELISEHDKMNQQLIIEKELEEIVIINGIEIEKIGPGWNKNI